MTALKADHSERVHRHCDRAADVVTATRGEPRLQPWIQKTQRLAAGQPRRGMISEWDCDAKFAQRLGLLERFSGLVEKGVTGLVSPKQKINKNRCRAA